jgi:hypothetical protein
VIEHWADYGAAYGPDRVYRGVAERLGTMLRLTSGGLVFDGGLLHAGNTPRTNAPRININIDAFVYEGAQTLSDSAEARQAGAVPG